MIELSEFFNNPSLIQIGPLKIQYYALTWILSAVFIFQFLKHHKISKELGLDAEKINDMVFFYGLFMGAMCGGRIGYMLFYAPSDLISDPLSLIRIWEGGLSFHGGLLGVILALIYFCKKQNIYFPRLMDSVALGMPIGLGLVRVGNFLNGELYGRPTNGEWGFVFPTDPFSLPRHPSQLYESFGEGIVLFLLLYILSKYTKAKGVVASSFLIFYGSIRFIIEYFRQPDAHIGYLNSGMTMGQLLCVPMIFIGIILVLYFWKKMKAYLELLEHILENGEKKEDRTGTGTLSSFGHQLSFNLEEGFPAVTTKSLAWKGVVSELLWFLEGSDDERRLAEIRFNKDRSELTDLEKYSTIWTDNADNQGRDLGYENTDLRKKLGPIYGVQWRDWNGVDQVKDLLENLKNNPDGRRHILSAWNVSELDKMALPPCHVMSQYYISAGTISCHMYQRSADMFLGVPFNIASYALLLSIFGKILNLKPKKFVHSFGDAHIYLNSVDQVKEQLSRTPKKPPQLNLPDIENLDDINKYSIDDFKLEGYEHHPPIKAKMAI